MLAGCESILRDKVAINTCIYTNCRAAWRPRDFRGVREKSPTESAKEAHSGSTEHTIFFGEFGMSSETEEARRRAIQEQEARDEMAKAVEANIIEPFGLLAGLLASVDDDETAPMKNVGALIGLMVNGSRKELEVQRVGGYAAQAFSQLLESKNISGVN